MIEAQTTSGPLNRKDFTLQVALSPDSPTQYKIEGTLSWRGSLQSRAVQLLVPGIMYARNYWDFSAASPVNYSYVDHATKANYATFNIDRIGIGRSDRPPAHLVNVESNAYVVHQIIQALRAGRLGGEAFDRVALVGHSLGSLIGIRIAVSYPEDIDALVLTGFLHNINPAVLPAIQTSFYPASQEPLFAGQNLPEGYLTSLPGIRRHVLFDPERAEEEVIVLDEAQRFTVTFAELDDFSLFTSPESKNVRVPVFLLVAENDFLVCGGEVNGSAPDAVQAFESKFFSPEARLTTAVIPGAGHSLNLHTNAPTAYAAILDWMRKHAGPNSNASPRSPDRSE